MVKLCFSSYFILKIVLMVFDIFLFQDLCLSDYSETRFEVGLNL